MTITKPLLAGKADLAKLTFPVGATPKLDGIRALKVDGKLVSRSFKPIKNDYIRTTLELLLPDGADGEVMVGTTFQECSSGVMRQSGTPDFTFYMFDYVKDSTTKPYMERMKDMQEWYDSELTESEKRYVKLVLPEKVSSVDELNAFEARVLEEGYEGAMVRKLDGPYKCGRSSTNEGILLKIKRFVDAEAVVLGSAELLHNENEAKKDAFGRTERSSHKENKTGGGVLGKLLVRDLETGLEFSVGTGFDAAQRAALWADRENLVGKIITYKSFQVGVKELPRHPVFLHFRHEDDMG